MKTRAVAVHAIEVFDYWLAVSERARAVRAFVVERCPDQFLVFLAADSEFPVLANSPAEFVEEHANDLIRNVGFGPSRRRPQLRGWVFHLSSPNSQLT
jgi:hypothetical protein